MKQWTKGFRTSPSCDSVTYLKLYSVAVALGPKSFVGIVDIGLVLVAADDWLHLAPDLHKMLGVPENHLQQCPLQPRKMVFLRQELILATRTMCANGRFSQFFKASMRSSVRAAAVVLHM